MMTAIRVVIAAALLGSCLAIAPHKREVRNPLHAHLQSLNEVMQQM